MNWDDYTIYEPLFDGPLAELSRRQARSEYDKLMAEKAARIAGLRRWLATLGLDLDRSDTGIQQLNNWFRASVQEDADKPGRLQPEWYSVIVDIGLFLGDVMIERHPNLHWEFFTSGRRNVSYQRPVIMGFSKSSSPDFNVNLETPLAIYGHRITEGLPVHDDQFLRLVEENGKWA